MTTYTHIPYPVEATQAPGQSGRDCGDSIENLVAWLNKHALLASDAYESRVTWEYNCATERGAIHSRAEESIKFGPTKWIVKRGNSFFTMSTEEFRKEFETQENPK